MSPGNPTTAFQTDGAAVSANGCACRVVGLIGGVGSGKSSVSRGLAESIGDKYAVTILDADRLGHEVLETDSVRSDLVARFGDEILDPQGSVVRSVLASRVFGQSDEHTNNLLALNAITHPAIRERITSLIQEATEAAESQPGRCLILLDAALLLEAGWNTLCDAVVFVDSRVSDRQQRVTGRGWSSDELAKREATQLPLDQKRQLATHCIENTGELSVAVQQLRDIVELVMSSTSPTSLNREE